METNDILNMYFELIEDKRDQFTIKHKLIDMLDVEGMIITADAMHCLMINI